MAASSRVISSLRTAIRLGAVTASAVRPPQERAQPDRSLANGSDGEVLMVLMLTEGTEVEVKLPGRFKVSPQIAGAIKAVPGVVAVEAV